MRDELNKAKKEAGVADSDFRLVAPHRWEPLLNRILETFTKRGKSNINSPWLWEDFKEPQHGVCLERVRFDFILEQLLPPNERLWLIAKDWDSKKHGNYWLYDVVAGPAINVLGHCSAFEYYFVDRKLRWLLCENHHDAFIGTGHRIVDAIKALELRAEVEPMSTLEHDQAAN